MSVLAKNEKCEQDAQCVPGEVRHLLQEGVNRFNKLLEVNTLPVEFGKPFAFKKRRVPSVCREDYEWAVSFLESGQNKITNKLHAVLRALQWEMPYIAFYGETNAGKSTLIEALRLYGGVGSAEAGREIGDGRSDFSRKAMFYPSEIDGRAFTLIDVPGVEGDERVVSSEIEKALSHAQIVFYVTDKAQPPQGGEEGRKGTLEKMTCQLASHANVWAIWNSKVNNPRGLRKPLVQRGSDTWNSLHEGANSLDEKLRDVLGERYKDCLAVSARPAFLALLGNEADRELLEERDKFLKHFSPAELLTVSQLDDVVDLLRNGIPRGEQLIASNMEKLIQPLERMRDKIREQAQEKFRRPGEALRRIIENSRPSLKEVDRNAARNAKRLRDQIVDGVINKIRSEMGEAIDAGMENSDFKKRLEAALDTKRNELEAVTRAGMDRVIENTKEAIRDVLKEQVASFEDDNLFRFDSSIFNMISYEIDSQIDDGIDWVCLSFTVIGGVAAVIFSGGWVLLFSLVGVFMGIVRSFWDFFDDDARKDNQRKKLKAELEKAKGKLSDKVTEGLKDFARKMGDVSSYVVESLTERQNALFEAASILEDVERELGECVKSLRGNGSTDDQRASVRDMDNMWENV